MEEGERKMQRKGVSSEGRYSTTYHNSKWIENVEEGIPAKNVHEKSH